MVELLLLVCLIILVVWVWKPAKKAVLGALDARAEKIRSDLDEAQRLHEEAKALLAKYQRQLGEGEELAAGIAAQAEVQRQRFEAKMRGDFELAVKRRTELPRVACSTTGWAPVRRRT
jgi:F-type H+-transporting ATPase subunit b